MFLAMLNTKAEKEFGLALANFYISHMPLNEKSSAKQFASKSEKVLSGMTNQVNHFKKTNPLNFYKKAQIGNAFKWALKDHGYDDTYIARLTEWLLTALQ